jgi:hypothetical protein
MLRSVMDAGQLSFEYQFQRQGHQTKWKKLEEGSTKDDIWEVIGRALEDLSSPGRHPHVRLNLHDGDFDIKGTISLEVATGDPQPPRLKE